MEVQSAGETVIAAEDAPTTRLLDEQLLDPPAPGGHRRAAALLAPVAIAGPAANPSSAPVDSAFALDHACAAARGRCRCRAHRLEVMRAQPIADGRVAPAHRLADFADRQALPDELRELVARQRAARPVQLVVRGRDPGLLQPVPPRRRVLADLPRDRLDRAPGCELDFEPVAI